MATVARVVSRSAWAFGRRLPGRRKQEAPLSFPRYLSSTARWLAEGGDSSTKPTRVARRPLPDFIPEDLRAEWEALTPEQRAQDEATVARVQEQTYVRTYLDEDEQPKFDALSAPEQAREQAAFAQELEEWSQGFDAETASAEAEALTQKMDLDADRNDPVTFPDEKPEKVGFWAMDEDDEFGQVEDDDDDFRNDDITSIGHAHLELHREMRHYARIAAWDMPLLSSTFSQAALEDLQSLLTHSSFIDIAKPFEPPTLSQPLRFRYTTYMGESHPAARKVVATFCSKDLMTQESASLTEEERLKLIKIAGVRYNPSSDEIKISCEKFESAAQNKRYVGDLIQTLIAEAKDTTDTFKDIPLDFRHHRPVQKPAFPEGWRLSRERSAQLVANRKDREAKQLEREQRYLLVDGREVTGQHVSMLVQRGSVTSSRPLPWTPGSRLGGSGLARQGR